MGNILGRSRNSERNGEGDSASTKVEEKKYQCIKCIEEVHVSSSTELEAGDHVAFRKPMYDHHMIITKCLEPNHFVIAEATNTSFLGAFFMKSSSSASPGQSKVNIKAIQFDFQTDNIVLFVYKKRLTKSETVKLAEILQNGMHKDYKYNLKNNNCEHFATFCVTGEKFSGQAIKVEAMKSLFFHKQIDGISDERLRNEKLFSKGLLCNDCYQTSSESLDVDVIEIRSKNDIQIGDIIRYRYWRLWHDAIVLQKKKESTDAVTLSIAHYAFCGITSHRTILREDKTIKLDGSCRKLDYKYPRFLVYDPIECAKRAISRIGEQSFVFFSNDSSHFARWCKLI